MTTILECPICRSPLLAFSSGLRCSQNHSFDAARQGYVNLLPVNKKHSRDPGDSKEMILSRRRFLDLGFYARISDGINKSVADTLALSGVSTILDAGCGEGFYLKRLKDFLGQRGLSGDCYGVDISKHAVLHATRRDRSIRWFVASNKDMPFAQASFDVVMNIFSPPDFPEFSRILNERGKIVIVSPGPRHLNGLREIIYPNVREHPPSTVTNDAAQYFSLSAEERITYPIELTGRESILDLLSMTPYFWNIDLKTRARVEELDRLALDVDVEIHVLRKRQ